MLPSYESYVFCVHADSGTDQKNTNSQHLASLDNAQSVVHLVVSPHFDDAVLSCGAMISAWGRQGLEAIVVTVFGGGPDSSVWEQSEELSPVALEEWSRYPSAPLPIRIAEDVDAVESLGAKAQYFDFPELIYRHREDGRWRCESHEDLFDPNLIADDEPVIKAVEAAISDLLNELCSRSGGSTVCVHGPAAVGNHTDHIVVREALRRVSHQRDSKLFDWYADVPYALRGFPRQLKVASEISIVDEDIEAWLRACACYTVEMRVMFGDTDWVEEFRRWARCAQGNDAVRTGARGNDVGGNCAGRNCAGRLYKCR